MYVLIDNYDSFAYNLLHFMGEEGAEMTVRRNDAVTIDQALALGDQGIVLSPGPCDPDQAGICLELITAAAGQRPILGVCLGHQACRRSLDRVGDGDRLVASGRVRSRLVTGGLLLGAGSFGGRGPFAMIRFIHRPNC